MVGGLAERSGDPEEWSGGGGGGVVGDPEEWLGSPR